MNVDVIMLANTKDVSLYGVTQRAINTLQWSEKEYKFNINIVESNKKLLDDGFVYYNCNVIIPDEEFGYNKFLNHGLKFCTSDWIIVANNDLIFTQNWFSNLMEYQTKNPDVLSLSPWEPNWHLKLGMTTDQEAHLGYHTSYEITGWCLVMHKEVIVRCSLFDPKFKFWYQDNDYALTLQKYKVKHALVVNSRVYHMVSGSHHLLEKNNKYNMTDGQLQVLQTKWGVNV